MKGIDKRIDRCDALDLLEEAVLTKRPLTLALEGGERVTGQVREVVTMQGHDQVFLVDGTCLDLDQIVGIDKG